MVETVDMYRCVWCNVSTPNLEGGDLPEGASTHHEECTQRVFAVDPMELFAAKAKVGDEPGWEHRVWVELFGEDTWHGSDG